MRSGKSEECLRHAKTTDDADAFLDSTDDLKKRHDLSGRPLVVDRKPSLFEMLFGKADPRKASDFIQESESGGTNCDETAAFRADSSSKNLPIRNMSQKRNHDVSKPATELKK